MLGLRNIADALSRLSSTNATRCWVWGSTLPSVPVDDMLGWQRRQSAGDGTGMDGEVLRSSRRLEGGLSGSGKGGSGLGRGGGDGPASCAKSQGAEGCIPKAGLKSFQSWNLELLCYHQEERIQGGSRGRGSGGRDFIVSSKLCQSGQSPGEDGSQAKLGVRPHHLPPQWQQRAGGEDIYGEK